MPLADTPMTDVLLRRPQTVDGASALFVVVLDTFLRVEDRLTPAGHDRLHE
jgi:hypothetical protein